MKFYKKQHKYIKDNIEYISVTTLLDDYFSKFNPTEVARQLAKYPINKAQKRGVRYWKKLWKELRDYGTKVHADIQKCILNSAEPQYNESINAINWLNKYFNNKNMLIQSEVIIYNDQYRIAGTVDLIGIDYTNNEYTIIDWKVVKAINMKSRDGTINSLGLEDCNYNKYALQLNLYKWILEQWGHKIKELKLVQLYNDKVMVYTIPYMPNEVKKILEDKNCLL